MTHLPQRILPIVVIDSVEAADPLADALIAGGVHQVEVTLRTPAALQSLHRMARHSELAVGVGTVLTAHQVEAALDAGAKFIVSPGLIEPVLDRAATLEITAIPGVATPTELAHATGYDLDLIKLFPAEPLGGTSMLSAMASVFPDVRFVPSGGINAANASKYLAHPAVATVGGSWMVPRDLIRAGEYGQITQLCVEALALT